MTDYEALAQRLLGCEARERRMHLWCETHDEPWPCPRADEVADEVREVVAGELEAVRARATKAEHALYSAGISHTTMKALTEAHIGILQARLKRAEARLAAVRALLDRSDYHWTVVDGPDGEYVQEGSPCVSVDAVRDALDGGERDE